MEEGRRRHALVVVESSFGNTRAVAEAIADGFDPGWRVGLVDVDGAPSTVDPIDLLVVGGPTHAFGMSRPETRREASARGGRPVVGMGVREWLDEVELTTGQLVAAFDTRIHHWWLPGSAAHTVLLRLQVRGGVPLARPASFHVTATVGPLEAGELARASAWGGQLGVAVEQRQHRSAA
jgi:hypothetical protein